jgi:hypothetical protein
MNETTLEKAREAKPRAEAAFRRKKGAVVGVGITRIDGGYGLKINLGEAPAADVILPESVDGVPIRVEVVGPIRRL